MSRPRAELIAAPAADLGPVTRRARPAANGLLWLASAWVFVAAATLAAAPMRPGFATQLAESPHFLLESLLGFVAGAATVLAAFELGIPAPERLGRRLRLPALLLLGWAAAYVLGLWHPALEPSMLGKRAHCDLQTALIGTPPLLAGLLWLRRFATTHRVAAGAAMGAAAGALPGLIMQIACMYDPAHILWLHLLPIVPVALLGALLGPLFLRRL